MARTIVVLSDGETWSELGGKLVVIPDEDFEKLSKGEIKVEDCGAIAHIDLLPPFGDA